jgi:7,8-dihydroneopterin aldolase/epimerase/oxygenase
MGTEFSDDAIHIEQLEMFAHVGVPDSERSAPQRITVTVTAWPNAGFRRVSDDIGATINYSAIARVVREVVDERRDKLIETLAESIAAELLKKFPVRRVRLELRKFVMPDAAYVSVMIARDRRTD